MTTSSEDIATPPSDPPSESVQPNILDLNDDCLIKVFSYFTDYQLVDFLGICSRLDEIIHINLRRCKSISFNFRYLNSDTHFEKLLWTAGPYLSSIEFSVGYSISSDLVLTALKPIARCERLQNLTLHYVNMCKEYLLVIRTISDHLEKIDFSFCMLTDELMDEFFRKHCGSLKELYLIGNYTFCGNSLVHLRGLKKLVLENHENFCIDMHLVKENNPGSEVVIYLKGRVNTIDANI